MSCFSLAFGFISAVAEDQTVYVLKFRSMIGGERHGRGLNPQGDMSGIMKLWTKRPELQRWGFPSGLCMLGRTVEDVSGPLLSSPTVRPASGRHSTSCLETPPIAAKSVPVCMVKYIFPSVFRRGNLKTVLDDGLNSSVTYSWHVKDTVNRNVLFADQWNMKRFQDV